MYLQHKVENCTICRCQFICMKLNWIAGGGGGLISTAMTKKTASYPSIRKLFWFGWKIVVALSISLCLFAILRLQHSHLEPSPSYMLSRRSRIPIVNFQGDPKLAFLFLVRRNLPLDFLWGTFFEVGSILFYSTHLLLFFSFGFSRENELK